MWLKRKYIQWAHTGRFDAQDGGRPVMSGCMAFMLLGILLIAVTSKADAASFDLEQKIRYLQAKKFYVYGDLNAGYEYRKEEQEGSGFKRESDTDSIYQNHNLHLTSFVYHPKLLMYTLGVNYVPETWRDDDWVDDTGFVRYSANLDFFRTGRFNLSLRGSYVDYKSDQELITGGLSLKYLRKRKKIDFKSMREYTLYQNTQKNVNSNNNDDDEENDTSLNEQRNQNQNQNQRNYELARRRLMRGSFFDRILPIGYFFDIDVYKSDNGHDDKGLVSSFRMTGDYRTLKTKTDYAIGLDYWRFENVQSEDTQYSGEYRSSTTLSNKDIISLLVDYTNEEDDPEDSAADDLETKTLNVNASYSGAFARRQWNYNVSVYHMNTETENSIDYDREENKVLGSVNTARRYGRVSTALRLGGMYQTDDTKDTEDSYSAFAEGSAAMMLSRRLKLDLSSNLNWGREVLDYGFHIGADYYLTNRVTLYGSYDLTVYDGEYAELERWDARHQFRAGARANTPSYQARSLVIYTIEDESRTASWSNTFSTFLFRKVRWVITGDLQSSKPEGADESEEEVQITNLFSMSPWYRTALRLDSTYSQSLDRGDDYTFAIEPAFSWNIRQTNISTAYRYETQQFPSGREDTEHRFYFKLRRSFFL